MEGEEPRGGQDRRSLRTGRWGRGAARPGELPQLWTSGLSPRRQEWGSSGCCEHLPLALPPSSPPSACLLLLGSWGPRGRCPQTAAPLARGAQSPGGERGNRPDNFGACASFSGLEPWPSLEGGRRETPETRFPPGLPLETLLCCRANKMGL